MMKKCQTHNRSQHEGAGTGQIKDNLSIKIKNSDYKLSEVASNCSRSYWESERII
jgi:hypothetical protein